MGADVIPVAVIGDHPIFRKGLAQVLQAHPALQLVGTAGSIEDFDSLLPLPAAIVLLDLHLPALAGAAVVAHLVEYGHTVLVLSVSESLTDVRKAIAAGASGYLTKQADETEILRAIKNVATGRSYVSANLSDLLQTPPCLTQREREVLEQVAEGETDHDIAEALGISLHTVHSHLDRIRAKTGSRRRPDLTRYALKQGIISTIRRG